MDNKIPLNSYVKLKEGFAETDVYRNVDAGATGWVRHCKVDDDGFSMIFIEWDETNPKYAGEVDKWAFENHFEIISSEHNDDKVAERYIESIRIATDEALASDGFIMVTVRQSTAKSGKTIYEPAVFGGEMNKEVLYILEAQIAYMANTLLQDFIQTTLNSMNVEDVTEKDDESGR
jgi:hypothetical protein